MPTYKEWTAYREAHPEVGRTAAPVDARQTAEVTERAKTVVTHPGWQLFLDRLAARRDLLDARRRTLERELLDGDALGETLEVLKIHIRQVKGELMGLDFAAEIVPDMIQAGEARLTQLLGEPSGDATR